MDRTLLVDIGPAVGGHGRRGIGRYVRGLAACVQGLPDDLTTEIYALGFPGPTLDAFGERAIAYEASAVLARLSPWAAARFSMGSALHRSEAGAFHATDPQRPWAPSTRRSLVTVYDLIPLHEVGMIGSWRLDNRVLYRWYLRQVKSATRVLAISKTTADDVHKRLGIPVERIDVVYPVVAAPQTIHRIEPPEPTFLFVGALDAHKQPELAVRAFALFHAQVKGGRLRFIGPANATQVRQISELASGLGVAGSVTIEGRISDDHLEHAYASATALVMTSRIEGFGLPAVEAVLRGTPVIAVETRAAVETLAAAATLVPADAEAIAEAMANPELPGGSAVDSIRERYSISTVTRSLADCYRVLLD